MIIQVKLPNSTLTFDEWRSRDPDFLWCRDLIRNVGNSLEGIVLGRADYLIGAVPSWKIKFFGVDQIHDIWRQYPHPTSWPSVQEAKQEFDKFLHRINSLGAFL
jgi:hypothetical protein